MVDIITQRIIEGQEKAKTMIKKNQIYDSLPEGWKIRKDSIAPQGYIWIWNGKSRFGGEYRHGLMKVGKEGK